MKRLSLVLTFMVAMSWLVFSQVPKPEWLVTKNLPLSSQKTTFKMLIQAVPEVADFKTNWFTTWLEAKTNVAIDWIVAPNDSDAAKQKMNLLIASGDFPEIINSMPFDAALEAKYGTDEKILLPVEKFIDDPAVMPNLNGWLRKNPSFRGQITAVDGHIYGFPNINVCYHCSLQQKMWINQDWLKKVGLKMPTTTDELYNVLKAFATKDPNGNGKADEIPLIGATDGWNSQVDPFLMSSFVLDPGMNQKLKLLVDTKSGKVMSALNQAGYKDGLKYIAKLYREKLYYGNSIIQKNDQGRQLLASGVVGAFMGGYPGVMIDGADKALWRAFVNVPPLKSPSGYSSTPFYVNDGVRPDRVLFTTALKDPKLAARWVDLFYTYEMGLHKTNGEPLVRWHWASSTETGLDGKPAIWVPGGTAKVADPNGSWQQQGIEFATAEFRNGQVSPPGVDIGSPDSLEPMLILASKANERAVRTDVVIMPNVSFTSKESEDLQIQRVELERYAESQRIAFITGATDVDAGWAAYLKKLGELGLAKVTSTYQSALDRQNKR